MRTVNRAYSDDMGDFFRVSELLRSQSDYLRRCSAWNLARFVDWKYGLYRPRTSKAGFWGKNAQLWFDGFDKLAGMAISEDGSSGFAIITAEGYRFLFEEMLCWVLDHWINRSENYSIEIAEQQAYESEILEKYDFKRDSVFFTRCFDLTMEIPNRFSLERGFEIIDMASNSEYRQQRILRAEAFSGIREISEEELEYQLEFYNYTHHSPLYHPNTDLCVKYEDGRHVACCEALIDAWNCVADIERICTHSDFRRRGFARAVIQECLHRLKSMGIQKAYIMGYSPEAIALYGSLGAAGETKSWIYIKE